MLVLIGIELALRTSGAWPEPGAPSDSTPRADAVLLQATANVLAAAFVLVLAAGHGALPRELGLNAHRLARQALAGVIAYWGTIPIFAVAFAVSLFAAEALGLSPVTHPVQELLLHSDAAALAAAIFLAVVVAPVTEEIYFRGFLFPAVERLAGPVAATCTSALFFAVVHPGFHSLLPIFVLGVLFAHLYRRTRTLAAPIAAHALHNGATIALALASAA